jgi:hypothetical protein
VSTLSVVSIPRGRGVNHARRPWGGFGTRSLALRLVPPWTTTLKLAGCPADSDRLRGETCIESPRPAVAAL